MSKEGALESVTVTAAQAIVERTAALACVQKEELE